MKHIVHHWDQKTQSSTDTSRDSAKRHPQGQQPPQTLDFHGRIQDQSSNPSLKVIAATESQRDRISIISWNLRA